MQLKNKCSIVFGSILQNEHTWLFTFSFCVTNICRYINLIIILYCNSLVLLSMGNVLGMKHMFFQSIREIIRVCLFVCGQHYSKHYERIGITFYGGVLGSTMKNWLNFGGDLGIPRWVNEQKNTIIVVAYPDRGAGNDPKLFFFFFFFFLGGGGGLVFSPPKLNIFYSG